MTTRKKILSFILSLTLLISSILVGTGSNVEAAQQDPAVASIPVKVELKTPEGVTAPSNKFNVRFVPIDYKNSDGSSIISGLQITNPYDDSNNFAFDLNDTKKEETKNILASEIERRINKSTSPGTYGVLLGLENSAESTGIYAEENMDPDDLNSSKFVKEVANEYKEEAINSIEKYFAKVTLAMKNGEIKVVGIALHKITGDVSNVYFGDPKNRAIITKGTNDLSTEKVNEVVFTNTYNKTLLGDSADPTKNSNALSIEKKLAGDGVGTAEREAEYKFNLTLTAPEMNGVNGGNPAGITAVKKKTGGVDETLQITYGVVYPFTLKEGEKLVFTQLQAGTKFTASEDTEGADSPYKQLNFTSFTNSTITGGAEATETAPTNVALVAKNNSFVVTNTKNIEVPTGIFYDNLPMIAFFTIMSVAVGGYVFMKKHVKIS